MRHGNNDALDPTVNIQIFMFILMLILPTMMIGHSSARGQIGDWIIETPDMVLESETKVYTESIIVENGGVLSILNSTVTFDLIKDGSEGLIVKRGGTLRIVNSKIDSKRPANAPIFISSGDLRIEDSGISNLWGNWEDGGGVRIEAGKAIITDTVFKKNKRDAITVHGGTASILRGDIQENVVGIRCQGAEGVLIEDNHIAHNIQQGIILLNSSAVMKRNTFENNAIAVAASSSDINLKDNKMNKNGIGIDLAHGARGNVSNNEIVDNGDFGVRTSNSTITLMENDINSNGLGVQANGGNVDIRSNNILTNDFGLRAAAGASGLVQDNTFGGNTVYGIYTVGDDLNVQDNVFELHNGLARFARAWVFQVQVEKDQEPVEGANVTIKNRLGSSVFRGDTNESGFSHTVELIQWLVNDDGETINMTPHIMKVKHGSNKDQRKVQMVENQTIRVKITHTGASGNDLVLVLALSGVSLMLVAGGIGVRIWLKGKDKGPERKSKQIYRPRRGSKKRSLSRTRTKTGSHTRRKGGKKGRKRHR